jgi:hypothetical protein
VRNSSAGLLFFSASLCSIGTRENEFVVYVVAKVGDVLYPRFRSDCCCFLDKCCDIYRDNAGRLSAELRVKYLKTKLNYLLHGAESLRS